jgi:hypothetical protein
MTLSFMHAHHPPSALDWRGIGRRRFVKLLATAGASGALLPLTACAPASPTTDRFLVLSAVQATTLAAVAQAVIPPQAGFPTVEQAQVVQRMDEELWLSDASIQEDMCAALAVMEWLPLAYGHWGRFSSLDASQILEVLTRSMESSIEIFRAVGTNLKLVSHFMYFGHPSAWAAIGYDGPFQKLPPILSEQRKTYALRVKESTR